MRYAIDLSAIGPWGSPRSLADLAALAERSGWDGVFVEDYLIHPDGLDAYDPWVSLAAIAAATDRIRIGTLVAALPRRRPGKLAAEAVAIDHLSDGRMILGVGSGDPTSPDITRCGEVTDARRRGEMLDEALELIDRLWAGEPVTHHGRHYTVDDVALRPRPVQRPRIPIWVGGQVTRRRPRERALRWDGSCLYKAEPPAWKDMTGEDVRELASLAAGRADGGEGFDIVIGGRRRGDDEDAERSLIASVAEAGATWWNEWVPPDTPRDRVCELIAGGPLRADRA
jgi:alkanesulfonate monooxygenase SsuD/methylene tetrahydromethanopterin reductase-like flavin-dependent oxidoreductase (luciferase family)